MTTIYKLLVHFGKDDIQQIGVLIEDKDRIMNAMLRNSVVEVSDFGWNPVNPRLVIINGKKVTRIVETGKEIQ